MSIVFEVGSISRHPTERKEPRAIDILNQSKLDSIQRAFGWNSIPWEEPVLSSISTGLSGGTSVSRRLSLENVARTLESLKPDHNGVVEVLAAKLLNSKLASNKQQIEPDLFPQLLSAHWYYAYWIPVEFDTTLTLEILPYTNSDKTISVGSIFRLEKELAKISSVLGLMVKYLGTEAHMNPLDDASFTWEDIWNLSTRMHTYTQGGCNLNLPFSIVY